MNRVIITITILLMLCVPISICALTEEVSEEATSETVVEKRNVFEELYYRIVLKDTRDFYDYVIFGILAIGLLIVMIFQNTHYYVVKVNKEEPKKHYNKPQYENKPKYENQNNYHKKRNYHKKKKVTETEN